MEDKTEVDHFEVIAYCVMESLSNFIIRPRIVYLISIEVYHEYKKLAISPFKLMRQIRTVLICLIKIE